MVYSKTENALVVILRRRRRICFCTCLCCCFCRCLFCPCYPHAMRFDDHQYYVYILASRSRTLYVGVTNNLLTRIAQHRKTKIGSFTSRYRTHRLVYYERFQYINNAIAREKYLKHFTRQEKSRSSKPPTQLGKTSPPNHFRFGRPPRSRLRILTACLCLCFVCFFCFLVVILPRSWRICFCPCTCLCLAATHS